MDIGLPGFRKVVELGIMSRWPIYRSDSGACGTRTRSPVFAPNPRCAVSSVIRRRASSCLPGAQKNGLRVLRANSFGLVRPAYTAGSRSAVRRHAQTVNTIRNDPARNAMVSAASDRSVRMYDAVGKELEQRSRNASQ